jgi:hypothetical protein
MLKLPLATWLCLGSAIAVVSVAGFTALRQSPKAIAETPQSTLIDGAIATEAQRIRSVAGSDPECSAIVGTDKDKVGCFLSRLETENQEAIAREVFRQRSLIEARKQWKR